MQGDFDPEAILRVLAAHDVEYVVIGGVAAFLQGSPIPTVDIDITPRADADNLARLSAALMELAARVRAEGTDTVAFSPDAMSLAAVDMWNLTTTYGDLDVAMTPAGTRGYDDLRRDAVELDISGIRVCIASLADIVRSKDAAGRAKDRRALPVLRELLARQTTRRRDLT